MPLALKRPPAALALSAALAAALTLGASSAHAQVTIADFESGLPPSWTTTGTAWTVGGTTGGVPTPQGQLFARSGAPNELTGPLAESLTGTLTSSPLVVSYTSIQWITKGWSGQFGNGLSGFQILDSGFNVKAFVGAPLSDFWSTQSVNLLSVGLTPGSTFYFRAVDGNSANSYAWLAVDDIKFTGAAVPEPAAIWQGLAGALMLGLRVSRRTRGRR